MKIKKWLKKKRKPRQKLWQKRTETKLRHKTRRDMMRNETNKETLYSRWNRLNGLWGGHAHLWIRPHGGFRRPHVIGSALMDAGLQVWRLVCWCRISLDFSRFKGHVSESCPFFCGFVKSWRWSWVSTRFRTEPVWMMFNPICLWKLECSWSAVKVGMGVVNADRCLCNFQEFTSKFHSQNFVLQ